MNVSSLYPTFRGKRDGQVTLRVHMLFADQAGCGDYRVRLPAAAVNDRSNLDVHVTMSDHLPVDASKFGDNLRIRSVSLPPNLDVLVIQRPMKAQMVGLIEWVRKRRPDVAIVTEIDDDLASVPYDNVAYRMLQPNSSPEENYLWLRRAIASSHLLTCSTPALAQRYGVRVPSQVIRNGVPTSMTRQPARTQLRGKRSLDDADENRVVGWSGWTRTHSGDLETMHGALADIIGADRTDGRRVTFRNIGPPDGLDSALGLLPQDVGATGWLSPDLYRVGMGQLDVGIVPLADTRFNQAKSALKALELSAAGVPVVASTTAEHIVLRDEGLPLWLVKPKRREWLRALRGLLDLEDDELRDAGRSAREHVRRRHTVELRADEWASAWRRAAELNSSSRRIA